MTTETVRARTAPLAPGPRRWAAMVVLVLAFMLDLLNVTIVNVGLPAISSDLGGTPAQAGWIPTAYLLAFAVSLISAARLGDLWGRRPVFLAGLAAFAATAVWSGLAQSAGELIAARAAQGIAAALVAPQVLSILYTLFDGRERATVFGLFGFLAGLAQAAGLALGGVLITADVAGLGWRTIFLISAPVAVVLVVAAGLLVPNSRAAGTRPPHWAAVAALTGGLVAIVYALLEGRAHHWALWVWALLAAGALLVIAVAVIEQRRPGRRPAALLPLELLRNQTVAVGLTVLLVAYAAFSAFLLVIVVWLQDGQGYSAMDAGLVTVAFSAGGLAMAGFVGRLTARFGRFVAVVGCLVATAGVFAVLAAGATTTHGISPWLLAPGLFALGLAMNLVMPTITTLYLSAVPPHQAGSASGIWNTAQQFGGAIGTAAITTVFFTAVAAGGYPAAITAAVVGIAGALVLSAVLSLGFPRRTAVAGA